MTVDQQKGKRQRQEVPAESVAEQASVQVDRQPCDPADLRGRAASTGAETRVATWQLPHATQTRMTGCCAEESGPAA